MKLKSEEINRQEIIRYLGYFRTSVVEEAIQEDLENVLAEMLDKTDAKYIYRIYTCDVALDKNQVCLLSEDKNLDVDLPDLCFESKNLANHLKECHKAAVMVATLGMEPEKMLNRYEIMNMMKAMLVQAIGATVIEQCCDNVQDEIQNSLCPGEVQQSRFSPGYGDLSLNYQKDIFSALDCTKRLGLTLTDSMLMYPTKSVSAIIGIKVGSEEPKHNKCEGCLNQACEFRQWA